MNNWAGFSNPLAVGFYTVPEAARLIEGGSARRIYGWLRGYPRRTAGPLIARDFEPFKDAEEISFLDMMELRLVEVLREHGVKATTVRAALVQARLIFQSEKPFATDRITLQTDGQNVFVEEVLKKVAKSEGDRRLWNLVTKQYEHYGLIERSLMKGVTFDPKNHVARTWQPRPNLFPSILIDPAIAYGKPSTKGGIPTDAAYELWQAENERIESVADWFNVPLSEAEMAVNFQTYLLMPSETIAA